MTPPRRLNASRAALAGILVVLLAFFGLLHGFAYVFERTQLRQAAIDHTEGQVTLIGHFLRASLIKRDYQDAEGFLEEWIKSETDLAELRATMPNGFVLMDHSRPFDPSRIYRSTHIVRFGDQDLMTIDITKDFTAIEERANALLVMFSSTYLVMVAILGGLLWFTVRNLALLPMERAKGALAESAKLLEQKNKDLNLALVASQKASQAKSQFLAMVGHELRTPLNAVIGFSELIRSDAMTQINHVKCQEYADNINESGRHLLDLINDILDVSKTETNSLNLNESDFSLVTLVRDLEAMMAASAKNDGISLSMNGWDGDYLLHADRRRIKQVLFNLLSNAFKFTPKGGAVTLRLEAPKRSESLDIQVRDTGIGIAPEDFPKALEPFGQVDNRLSRKFDGAGLGLPLSRCLVELHGGSLAIDSEPGVGTTVTVSLPRHRIVEERNAGLFKT